MDERKQILHPGDITARLFTLNKLMASIYRGKTAAEKYRDAICAHRQQQLKKYNPFRPLRTRLRDRMRLFRLRAVKLYREAIFKHTI